MLARRSTGSLLGSIRLAFGLCIALGLASCAAPPEQRTMLPTLESGDTDPAAGFEEPPVARAIDLLPPELIAGPNHRVQDEVRSDGFVRIYQISSDFGDFEVQGDDVLRIRIREIRALAALDEMSKREEFATAVAQAIKSPFVATWNLIRHPVDSVSGVPSGAWDYLKRTSELARGERGELEDSAFREFIGFEAKKRALAYELGVDPYSSNPTLQKQLNRFAWAAYLGGLPGMLVPFGDVPADSTNEYASGRGASAANRIRVILLEYSPEDLRRLNRIEMAVMGIPEELSTQFAAHRWYSPRSATLLLESLSALELALDRTAFLKAAVSAESESDARFYRRSAALLRAYSDGTSRIERIVAIEGSVAGLSADRSLLIPFPVDHAVWTRPTARFVHSITGSIPGSISVDHTGFLVSGTVSRRCRQEMEGLGFSVTEHALEGLAEATGTGTEADGASR